MSNESGKEKRKGKMFLVYDANKLGKKKGKLCREVVSVEDTQQKMQEVFYIALLHYFIYSMVSFQQMENGVEEDVEIHFVSTLKAKKKHARIEKKENSETGCRRKNSVFFPAGGKPSNQYRQ